LLEAPSVVAVALKRSDFIVRVADPLDAMVDLESASGRVLCEWAFKRTDKERANRCTAFFMNADGICRQVGEATDIGRELLLLHGSATKARAGARTTQSAVETAIRQAPPPLAVVGTEEWRISRIPWGETARSVLAELGSKPVMSRPLMRIMAMGVEAYEGSRTYIQPAQKDSKAQFWIRSNLVEKAPVEILKMPFGSAVAQKHTADKDGWILELELEAGESAGECFILALDPSNSDRIVADARLVVLDRTAW